MKQSKTFIPTMREIPSDAFSESHELLIRAGYIRENENGVFIYLTLAQKVLHKMTEVIRQEMEAVEGIEISLPILQNISQPEAAPDDLFYLQDQRGRHFSLSSNDGAAVIALLRDEVQSYKKLPLTLFQVKTTFRDIKKTNLGLFQSRESTVKDAYSFHAAEDSLDEKYGQLMQAYTNIFTRLGLHFRVVAAETAGGAHEFIALAEIGGNRIAYSDSSTYAATIELAGTVTEEETDKEKLLELEKVATPNERTAAEVASFLSIERAKVIKSLLYEVDGEYVMILCRGNHRMNKEKIKRVLDAAEVELAPEEKLIQLLGSDAGSIGPVKLPVNIKVYADYAIQTLINGVCGANENGYHLKNVNPERDFAIDEYGDLRYVEEGDPSPDGIGKIQFAQGISVGSLRKLGSSCCEQINATFLNEEGSMKPFVTGCYNLGVTRLFAALAEQYHNDSGLTWPKQLAPFDIHLLAVNMKNPAQQQLADELYAILKSYRYDVLYDDRTVRAGVKFNDADLIGLPAKIIVGRRAGEGIVEVTFRNSGAPIEWAKEEVLEKLQSFFSAE